MLLLPIMFGCSKESNTIVGDWYICLTEYSDSSDPEAYHSSTYTKKIQLALFHIQQMVKVSPKVLMKKTIVCCLK